MKLLDFGTASLFAVENHITVTQPRMITPRYSAPEQLRGLRVDFRTDIFSLGVVVYEMLSGAWPFGDPASVLSGLNRAAGDISAQSPSQLVTGESAALRSTSHSQLGRMLKGDLSAIILKALENDPARRYGSVREFACDIENYLEGRPVLAHPQTALYRVGKSVRRRWRAAARAVWLELAVLAVAAICGAGFWFYWQGRASKEATFSIAVLPFENVGGATANRYFSDGVTDEIANVLSRLKTVRVIARSSAFQLRGKQKDIREAGRRLNATDVLEGSVERSGDQVKIVAWLERVSDGAQIWSRTFERQGVDLYSVESELVAGISASLGTPPGSANPARHVVRDAEAREAYMRGFYEAQELTPQSFDKAEADFKHAIERDSQYALAYAGLGAVILDRGLTTYAGTRTEAARHNAEQLFRKALALDPDLTTPRCTLAMMAMQYDWDWVRAEQEFQEVLAKGSNPVADQDYGFLLVFQRRFAEADEHLRRAQSLNPLDAAQINNLALIRHYEGRFVESRREAQRTLALYPNMLVPRVMISFLDIEESQTDRALADMDGLGPRFAGLPVLKAMALARAGRREEALRLIHPLEEKRLDESFALQWFALVYAFLGDEANTVKWLNRSADRREFQALNLAVHSAYAPMRNSPGFIALEKRMGLQR